MISGHIKTLACIAAVLVQTLENPAARGDSSPSAAPVARKCTGYAFPEVVCMHRYGSVLTDFEREMPLGIDQPAFGDTEVSGDSSFASVKNATFLIWDEKLAVDVLGQSPSYEFIFDLPDSSHEGPVLVQRVSNTLVATNAFCSYIKATDQIFFSRIAPEYLSQLVIDLSGDRPILSEVMASPPIYAPSGARYRDGLIYCATAGGNRTLGGTEYYSGLYTINPRSMKSRTLLDNYFGFFFDGVQ